MIAPSQPGENDEPPCIIVAVLPDRRLHAPRHLRWYNGRSVLWPGGKQAGGPRGGLCGAYVVSDLRVALRPIVVERIAVDV